MKKIAWIGLAAAIASLPAATDPGRYVDLGYYKQAVGK